MTVPAATATTTLTTTLTTTSTLRMDAEEAEIRQLVADAQKHQFDLVELMKLHHDEVVITNMAGRRVFGKQAFTEAMTRAMASFLQHVPTETAIDRLHFLSPDSAIVFCTKTVHDQRAASEKTPLPASMGMMSYVVVRKDDGWVIAAAQTTPVAG